MFLTCQKSQSKMLAYKIIFAFALFSIANCREIDIVQILKDRYYNNSKVCVTQSGNDDAAYACSGLIIRGVNVSSGMEHAWSMKPYNREKMSFSTSYLRVDTPFLRFPWIYTSGFTLFSPSDTPANKEKVEALCAFPIDGYTYDRGGKHGCGQAHDDPVGTSKPCDRIGITSFDEWLANYFTIRENNSNFPQRQCGLDMTLSDAANYFKIFLQASHFLRNNEDAKEAGYSYKNNEFLFRAWDENNPSILPIETFFFLMDFPEARADALMYQRDYYENTGEVIPVIAIRLPTKNDRAIYIEQVN